MIEIMAICKKKIMWFEATFYFQHNGVTAGVFPEGSIDRLSSSQMSSHNVFSDKQGRILQRNCVAETSARIWKSVRD